MSKRLLTAIDSTRDRILSPTSGLVSWPNCTKAPRNLRIFVSFPDSDEKWFPVDVFSDAGVASGGGVIDPELLFFVGELQPLRLRCCGDLGVTTLAPSGESGVRHWSFPKIKMVISTVIDRSLSEENSYKNIVEWKRKFKQDAILISHRTRSLTYVLYLTHLYSYDHQMDLGLEFLLLWFSHLMPSVKIRCKNY